MNDRAGLTGLTARLDPNLYSRPAVPTEVVPPPVYVRSQSLLDPTPTLNVVTNYKDLK